METKLVLSAFAPVADMRVAAPTAEIERAIATPMATGRNVNSVVNSTGNFKIHVSEEIGGERLEKKIDPGKTHEFPFRTQAQGDIIATIKVADGGHGPAPRRFRLSTNATTGGYYGEQFTVRITFNAFDVPGSFPISSGGTRSR
jgi:hypothetical protein